MKKIKITYWASTALLSIMMAFSAFSYLSSDASIAHIVSDGGPAAIAPFVSLILLITSYITYHRLKIYDKINVAV